MGDGGFWHNGLTSGVGNAVFNQSDNVLVIVDNGYSAATGGQDILSSRADNRSKSTKHPIAAAVKGVGVKWLRVIDRTYDLTRMRDALREAMTTLEKGPKVIVAASECMLNRQRRENPVQKRAIADGASGRAHAIRSRPGHLHGRSLLHPALGLSLAHDSAESGPSAAGSDRARRQFLRRMRAVRRSRARGGALPFVLSGATRVQSHPLGPDARLVSRRDHRLPAAHGGRAAGAT